MSCSELGFDDYGNLRTNKSQDTEEVLPFPSTYDFTGYTGQLQVRASEDALAALLTITTTPTAAGSVITFEGSNMTLLIKKADLATLPEDATDSDEPWSGVYQWVNTDIDGLTTQLVAGSFTAERGVVR